MPELLVFLGLAALAILVILRRYGAKRWSVEGRTDVSDSAGQTFKRVWLQTTPPRAAMGAWLSGARESCSRPNEIAPATHPVRHSSTIPWRSTPTISQPGRRAPGSGSLWR